MIYLKVSSWYFGSKLRTKLFQLPYNVSFKTSDTAYKTTKQCAVIYWKKKETKTGKDLSTLKKQRRWEIPDIELPGAFMKGIYLSKDQILLFVLHRH